jgi:hypothetical protein
VETGRWTMISSCQGLQLGFRRVLNSLFLHVFTWIRFLKHFKTLKKFFSHIIYENLLDRTFILVFHSHNGEHRCCARCKARLSKAKHAAFAGHSVQPHASSLSWITHTLWLNDLNLHENNLHDEWNHRISSPMHGSEAFRQQEVRACGNRPTCQCAIRFFAQQCIYL